MVYPDSELQTGKGVDRNEDFCCKVGVDIIHPQLKIGGRINAKDSAVGIVQELKNFNLNTETAIIIGKIMTPRPYPETERIGDLRTIGKHEINRIIRQIIRTHHTANDVVFLEFKIKPDIIVAEFHRKTGQSQK